MAFRAEGRVQGVGFRAFVTGHAQRLGLAGWVRNEMDGAVAGMAEGEPGSLETFRTALESGSPWARVSTLDWEPRDEAQSLPRPFEVRK